jgi:hypothetical protein
MKKFIRHSTAYTFLLTAFLLVQQSLHGQAYRQEIAIANETWVHQTHQTTLDGGTIIATKSQATMSATRFINLIKLDTAGVMQWQKSFGPITCTFENIVPTPDSGFFLCATNFAAMSYMVFKTDKNGNILFSRRVEVPSPYAVLHEGESIAKNDGGFYISSTLFDSSTATQCWHLVELDPYGIPVSSKLYDLNSVKTRLYAIDTCRNGDVLMLGSVFMSPYHMSKVARINKNTGVPVWSNVYKNQLGHTTMPNDLVCDTSDNVYVLTQYNSSLTPHVGVLKMDGAGNPVWVMEYSAGTRPLRPRSMMHTASGEVVIIGEELLMRIDPNGSVMMSARFPYNVFTNVDVLDPQTFQMTGSYVNSVNSMVVTCDFSGNGCEDSALVLTKTQRNVTDSVATGMLPLTLQHFVLNLMPVNKAIQMNDECEMTAIAEPEAQSPVKLFPNPANTQLTIRASELMHSAEIVSVTGQCVLTHVNTSPEYQLDISGVAAGCYVVRVVLENRSETFRLIVE